MVRADSLLGGLRWDDWNLGRFGSSWFRFSDTWQVEGNIHEVARALADTSAMPTWWAPFQGITIAERGESLGEGRVFRSRVRGYLPYVLQLDFRVVHVRYPNYYKVMVGGDLIGVGSGRLRQVGECVEVRLRLNVAMRRQLLYVMSLVARPLLTAHHVWTMRQGEVGLRREVARRRQQLSTATAAPLYA